MNNINYIYIIPLVATLLVAIYTFVKANNTTHNRKVKYLVAVLFVSIVSGVIFINFYYEQQFKKQSEALKRLTNKSQDLALNSDIDSLDEDKLQSIKYNSRVLIDSLRQQNKELKQLNKQIEEFEKIIGTREVVKNDIKRKIDKNNSDIGEIKSYNERLDEKFLRTRKGYMASGQSSSFIFECPRDYEADVLELKLKFIDERIVDEIEYITISFSEKVGDKNYESISNEIFKPQKDVNAFKIKNHFKNKKGRRIDLEVGYTLKSEANKDYPRFERVICKNY